MSRYRTIVDELRDRNARLNLGRNRAPCLAPTREGLARIGAPAWLPPPDRVIVVAGTNGKGSVAATLDALLADAGVRSGLFTSPHLVEPTERFRIGGRDVEPEAFVAAFDAIEPRVRDLPLGQFELLTLMMAWLFFSGETGAPVERAVLEIGMGGEFDPVNAIPHRYCALTPIAIDHEAILGPGLERIAAAKLGVVNEGAVVVHAPFPPEASRPLRATRALPGTRWIEAPAGESRVAAPLSGETDPRPCVRTPWGEARVTLPGPRGAQNTALALALFAELGFDPARHLTALARVRWPGRMQRIEWPGAPCPVHVSGDHNEAGMASLAELLRDFPRERLWLLLGTTAERNPVRLLAALGDPGPFSVALTSPPFKPFPLEQLSTPIGPHEALREPDPRRALDALVRRAGTRDRIVVTGSLYLVGEILRHAAGRAAPSSPNEGAST
jgi:dihydrofolate synthase/folylpolyglutamate synthase